MMSQEPPIRIVAPGRTFRKDSDATHTPMFHQIEGLVIGKDIHMGHLKTTLKDFVARFFELDDVDARFRPHHFPFTEPSAEMDIRCDRSGGGLVLNEGDDWLEILGCGMVHPNVLTSCGIDPDAWQGFAFGMGVDRLAMLKYGVPDLRPMFEADVRWLAHYGFSAFSAPNPASGLS
jgi:phenylalanyl-tRNA synthetase alpha chain